MLKQLFSNIRGILLAIDKESNPPEQADIDRLLDNYNKALKARIKERLIYRRIYFEAVSGPESELVGPMITISQFLDKKLIAGEIECSKHEQLMSLHKQDIEEWNATVSAAQNRAFDKVIRLIDSGNFDNVDIFETKKLLAANVQSVPIKTACKRLLLDQIEDRISQLFRETVEEVQLENANIRGPSELYRWLGEQNRLETMRLQNKAVQTNE